jgi:rubredoxin
MLLTSTITCPECGAAHAETMQADQCLYFYQCSACHIVLKPKTGDCCVFCS